MSTFLDRLEQELLVAGRRRQQAKRSRGLSRRRTWLLAGVPVLILAAVLVYVVAGSGSGQSVKTPLASIPSGYQYQTSVGKTKVVGSKQCVEMVGKRRVALANSDAAPDASLVSELSLLRGSAGSADIGALGNWDREQYPFVAVFANYVRVLVGPRNVRLAFFPAVFCNETVISQPTLANQRFVVRENLEQALFMIVLSNPGEHPPVLVGTAQQIRTGPALAGLGVEDGDAWVQAIVVPDSVARVVMKFTPPFLHHYSNTVTIESNVGIVVRRPSYTPTTVVWYGADGQVIKTFVFHREIAYGNCLREHKQHCGVQEKPTNRTTTPNHQVAYGPAALLKQANELYAPVEAYERSITAAEKDHARASSAHTTAAVNACDQRYRSQLFRPLNIASKQPAMERRVALYNLWDHVATMQTYQTDIAPFAKQIAHLAATWKTLSLNTAQMNEFAHAMASEFDASLQAAPISTCTFVADVAAHHFSYQWARNSTIGSEATRWWSEITAAGSQTASFWTYTELPKAGEPESPGAHLFTTAQLQTLANLPGEIG